MKKGMIVLFISLFFIFTVSDIFAEEDRFSIGVRIGRMHHFGKSWERSGEELEIDGHHVQSAIAAYRFYSFMSMELGVDYYRDVDGDYTGLGKKDQNYVNVASTAIRLSALFHLPAWWRFEPYAGVGLAFFDNEIEKEGFLDTLYSEMDLESSWGWLITIGTDIRLTRHIAANIDFQYYATDADLNWQAAGTGVRVKDTFSRKGIISGLGLKYRF